jgi:hypothetical protein
LLVAEKEQVDACHLEVDQQWVSAKHDEEDERAQDEANGRVVQEHVQAVLIDLTL